MEEDEDEEEDEEEVVEKEGEDKEGGNGACDLVGDGSRLTAALLFDDGEELPF